MDDTQKKSKQIQIKANEEISQGRYSNSMFIAHGPEEFIIDWLLNSPTGAHLVSRIIVTPGHVKRIISALSDNLKKHEEKFGEVKLTEPPDQKFH
ncbi:MAG: DUF3467 domain-containing protein [Desulfobacteraceae bacterium]|nr:DUF3467 domain-containing protein [Desulfobacteraceae bacterium]MBC2757700.1 DUF3467 domain-containing protein [Desulfobacteraceae bacterium]